MFKVDCEFSKSLGNIQFYTPNNDFSVIVDVGSCFLLLLLTVGLSMRMDFGIDDVNNVSMRGKTTIIMVFENMASLERREGAMEYTLF